MGSTSLGIPRDNGHWVGATLEVYVSACDRERNVVGNEIGQA